MGTTNGLYSRKIEIYHLKNNEVAANLITYEHYIIKGSRVITLDKLTSTVIYSILITKVQNKPWSNIYFEHLFNHDDINWTAIYTQFFRHNTYMRSFPYKILNNILYINKNLHIFGIASSLLCSFCNLYDEIPFHIFYECHHLKYL